MNTLLAILQEKEDSHAYMNVVVDCLLHSGVLEKIKNSTLIEDMLSTDEIQNIKLASKVISMFEDNFCDDVDSIESDE